METFTIYKYACINSAQEASEALSTLNKKVANTLEKISKLNILPTSIEIVLQPYLSQQHYSINESKTVKKHFQKLVAKVEINIDYIFFNMSIDEMKQIKEALSKLTEHEALSKDVKHIFYQLSHQKEARSIGKFDLVASNHNDLLCQVRDVFLNSIPEIDLSTNPNIKFTTQTKKIGKESEGVHIAKGRFEEEYTIPQKQVTLDSSGDEPR